MTPERLQNATFNIECFTGGDAEVQQDVRHPYVVAVVTDGVGALLREAAAAGAHALVDALVSGGVSPFLADESASTALHAAAANGHAKVCRRLVRAGTDGHVNNLEQISAFDLAFQGGHDQVRRDQDLPVWGAQSHGDASPPGWWTGQPECGLSGSWLDDCDREFDTSSFSLVIVYETSPRLQRCR